MKDKLALLAEWQARMEAADQLIEPVTKALGLSIDSPINQAVRGLQSAYTEAVGKLVGDQDRRLNWYANKNSFGRMHMEAGPKGATRHISTLSDLIWLMEAKTTLWCYSTNEEDFNGPFDTEVAAKNAAIQALDESKYRHLGDEANYWIANVAPAESFLHADRLGDWVVECLNEWLADEILSDGYELCDLNPDEQKELGEIIINFVKQKSGFKRFGVAGAVKHSHLITEQGAA